MLVIFCIAIAWAIRGALSQAWTDGRVAATSAGQAVKTRTARARKSKSRGVRWAAKTGTGVGIVTAGTVRAGHGVGRSLVTGARDGWAKGLARGRARRADKQARRGGHDDPNQPGWGHYITGRCPRCDHLPKQSAAETDGCPCENIGWGCQCAMRARSRERELARTEDDFWKGARPDAGPPPTDDREPTPAVPSNGGTMSVTTGPSIDGEAANIESTRHALEMFEELAEQHLDIASAAKDQAKGLAAAAEAMLAGMHAGDVDPQTIQDAMALQELARAQEEAASRLMATAEATHVQARATRDGINERHGLLEEATNASVHAPKREWLLH